MKIPNIALPEYETLLPISKQTIKFTPFTVRDEKLLLLVDDPDSTIKEKVDALIQVVNNCVSNLPRLHKADFESLFTQIRIKSIGEIVEAEFKCSCGQTNPYKFNLKKMEVVGEAKSKNVQLTPTTLITFLDPDISYMENIHNSTEDPLLRVLPLIKAVTINDEVYTMGDNINEEELRAWLETLTKTHVDILSEYLTSIPEFVYSDVIKCSECGKDIPIFVQGLEGFFS